MKLTIGNAHDMDRWRKLPSVTPFANVVSTLLSTLPLCRGPRHIGNGARRSAPGKELAITAATLARKLHVPAKRLSHLIAGNRAMTADTALRLEQWLGVSAGFRMILQEKYELDRASEESSPEIRRTVQRREQRDSAVPSCC